MADVNRENWQLWPLPIFMGVFPVAAALFSAYIAMRSGLVPSCFPFIEGCTSVSATGRYVPANYVFRGLMLPYAALFALYWMLVGLWLRTLDPAHIRFAAWTKWLGIAASLFLIVYVVLLGSKGDAYEMMRRYGIYFYFLFTFIAELLTAIAFRRSLPELRLSGNLQLTACVLMLGSGVLNLILKQVLADADSAENIIEWNFALVMFLNMCLVSSGWFATDFRWQISLKA